MNILFTRFPLESRLGGAEVQTMALMRGLQVRGHRVSFTGSCPTLLRLCQAQKIPARLLEIGPPPVTPWLALSFLWRQRKMQRQLSNESLQLSAVNAVAMLSLTEKLLLTKPLSKQGVQVLWIEHDRVGRWLRWNPWLPRLRRLSRLATTVCVSELSRQMYLDLGWARQSIVAIPNGIDDARLAAQTKASETHSSSSALHIGCVARLSHDKGIDVLIGAIGELSGVHLTIIGNGPEEAALKQLIERLHLTDRVTLQLEHDDLGSCYRSLDVFVLPSRLHDPFGLVAAEAMLCGVPTIVTDACGIAGYLRDGTDAIIVAADDQRALQEAIAKLQNDGSRRQALGTEGRQTARAKFRLEQMVAEYESLLLC